MKDCVKKSLKASNGITLIALVITIIVLLILAGISISMLAGDNSILQKATDAKTNTDNAQIRERIQLAYHSALTGGQGSYTKESLEIELEKEFGENNYNVDDSDSNNWILTGKVQEKEQNVTIPAGKVVDTTWQKAFEFPEYNYNRYVLDESNKELILGRSGPPITTENIEIKGYAIINGKKYITKFNTGFCNIFQGNNTIKTIKIDSDVDLHGNTVMSYSFCGMNSLEEMNMSGCDLSNVQYMNGMFKGLPSLKCVDMSNCNTDNLTNMGELFRDCNSITTIKLNNWNLSGVTLMEDLFNGCHKLTDLQISNWNTGNVVNMERMFASCYSLQTIDLSSFDTKNLESARWMFDMSAAEDDGYQAKLKTIYASEKFILKDPYDVGTGTRWENMFSGCTMLEGGEGTTFDSTKIYGAYAHIDGGTSNPGYFTAK